MKRYALFAVLTLTLYPTVSMASENVWRESLTGMSFISLPKGCYKMGAEQRQTPVPDPGWERMKFRKDISEDEVPVHEVCLNAFWLGATEVTVAQWASLTGGATDNGTQPVVRVTWAEAKAFAEKLSANRSDKKRFRLPTEAEWEYACRAAGGKDVVPLDGGAYGWFQNLNTGVQPVAALMPNASGLFDMLGNAWEWVVDVYHSDAYKQHALYNPVVYGDSPSHERVIRGGSVRTEKVQVRCAMRGHVPEDYSFEYLGFRLVMEE